MTFFLHSFFCLQNLYGSKQGNGSWSGLVGDLISGNIDISVATLTMTTEREEVIDFVAPYFDQSGISILIRKKAPERNMFKFMTVLRPEVWYGILGAVVGKKFHSNYDSKVMWSYF